MNGKEFAAAIKPLIDAWETATSRINSLQVEASVCDKAIRQLVASHPHSNALWDYPFIVTLDDGRIYQITWRELGPSGHVAFKRLQTLDMLSGKSTSTEGGDS